MPAIKSAKEISDKWARVTPARSPDYEAGVKSPKKDWGTETAAAESRYGEGVTAAIAEGRFGKGVVKAGTAKWKRKAVEVGVGRWGPGVRAAAPDYQAGFAPYRDVIEATTLPERFPKGDPRNIDRVAAIAAALHAAKVGA